MAVLLFQNSFVEYGSGNRSSPTEVSVFQTERFHHIEVLSDGKRWIVPVKKVNRGHPVEKIFLGFIDTHRGRIHHQFNFDDTTLMHSTWVTLNGEGIPGSLKKTLLILANHKTQKRNWDFKFIHEKFKPLFFD